MPIPATFVGTEDVLACLGEVFHLTVEDSFLVQLRGKKDVVFLFSFFSRLWIRMYAGLGQAEKFLIISSPSAENLNLVRVQPMPVVQCSNSSDKVCNRRWCVLPLLRYAAFRSKPTPF